jgi:transcriptional regulator with GAF, ATPase, and Fis domain
MESYVFGHEKGAFTGAVSQSKGAFEQANGGTLFMDEIGELDLSLQPKLLRVLENREFKRVGGTQVVRTDVRVIAATNRDLRQMVNEGTFREDLYFRLGVINIGLPSLRERREDIPLLVESFLADVGSRRPDQPKLRLTADALEMLLSYAWPGNVRELKNVIERAGSLANESTIERSDLQLSHPMSASMRAQASVQIQVKEPDSNEVSHITVDLNLAYKDGKQVVLDAYEYDYLKKLITEFDGNISQASKQAGLTRFHLRELLKKHDLK